MVVLKKENIGPQEPKKHVNFYLGPFVSEVDMMIIQHTKKCMKFLHNLENSKV